MKLFQFEQDDVKEQQRILPAPNQFVIKPRKQRSKLKHSVEQGLYVKNFLFTNQHRTNSDPLQAEHGIQIVKLDQKRERKFNNLAQTKQARVKRKRRQNLFSFEQVPFLARNQNQANKGAQKINMFSFDYQKQQDGHSPAALDSKSTKFNIFDQSYSHCTLVRDRSLLKYLKPEFKLVADSGQTLLTAVKQISLNSKFLLYKGDKLAGYLVEQSEQTFHLIAIEQNREYLHCLIKVAKGNKLYRHRKIQVYLPWQKVKFVAGQECTIDAQQCLVLKNKKPDWNPKLKCYVQNFNGMAKMHSVKNFILSEEGCGRTSLLLAKYQQDKFRLQISQSITTFVALGVALTSFSYIIY